MNQLIDSLRKKVQELEREKKRLMETLNTTSTRLNLVNNAIAGAEALLRAEGAVPTVPDPSTPTMTLSTAAANGSAPALPTVLHEVLADGKPHAVDELINVAKTRGVKFGTKDPVKTVRFTLVGISKGKKIQRTDDGRWQRAT